MERDDLVHIYFRLGLSQSEILAAIANNHGIVISKRTLKRVLSKHGLFRKKNKSDILDVCLFIMDNIANVCGLHGYTWMHLKCIQSGIVVSRENAPYDAYIGCRRSST
jgi:hypothetical protein